MNERGRQLHRWWLDGRIRWGAGAALLVVVVVQVGSSGVVAQLGRAELRIAVPAIVGLVAVHLLGAAAWRMLQLRVGGWAPPWPVTVRTYYVAQGIGGLTPANIGSDVYRVAAARRDRSWSDAALPILLQRVVSSAALAALAMGGLSVLSRGIPVPVWIAGGACTVVASAVGVAVVTHGRIRSSGSPGLARWRAWSVTLGATLVLSLAFHAASLGLALAIVASIAPIAAPLPILAALAVARLSLLVPITPSGLGVQEGLLAILFTGIGMPAEVALAGSLLTRASLALTTILGAALLTTRGLDDPAPSRPRAGKDALPG